MAGLTCKLCHNPIVDTQVWVIFNNKIVHKDGSALKVMDWALDNLKTPCVLRYIYVCGKCGFEDHKFDKYFSDRL